MSKPINIDKTLKKIAKKYKTQPLDWDESSESFVESVCHFFKLNDRVTDRQIGALVKITKNILQHGKQAAYVAKPEPDGKGFLGLNCKTGEVNWYSWQEFEHG